MKLFLAFLFFAIGVQKTIASSFLSEISQAESFDEILASAESHRSKQQRPMKDRLQGRQLQDDGTLEKSTHIFADAYDGEPGFYHSVASGDPLPEAVIIWTRYTPESMDGVTLEFRMSEVDPVVAVGGTTTAQARSAAGVVLDDIFDPEQNPGLKRGKVTVSAETDFIAKIDVQGLKSNTHYAFVFSDGEKTSDIGMTRTAPAEGDSASELIYAFFSCSHFSNGYFHAYDIASTIEGIDLSIFVGDYYYEYGLYDTYAKDAADTRDQSILPIWEVIDLQDYRNRHATYVGYDEGLQQIRRRVPMMAFWDDHETTNDSYGNVADGTGAENHQATCPVNSTSPDSEKAEAKCDRDEGDAVERFEAATQAFLEWMPIRYVEGSMGQMEGSGTLTKVIEWGDLATIVGFDTRISYRSEEPTGTNAFTNPGYGFVAVNETNVSAYSDPGTSIYDFLQNVAAQDLADRSNENFTMIGEYFDILESSFSSSKEKGKPWQIWAGNTMMGHYVLPDLSKFYLEAPEAAQDDVEEYFDALLRSEQGLTYRIIAALKAVDIEWNMDDYSGFHAERARIIEMAKNSANNMIVLGGDLHDGFAWVLVEGGLIGGEPVAVNLGTASVTSPGLAPVVVPAFGPIADAVGGEDGIYGILTNGFVNANPNLKFASLRYKGFTAVKATATSHTAEWFGVSNNDRIKNFTAARNGALTATPICTGSVTTQADTPGSLERNDGCSAITYARSRPAVYGVPVPAVENMPKDDALSSCGQRGCVFEMEEEEVSSPPSSGSRMSPLLLLATMMCLSMLLWGSN